ncbi:MAG: tetratricopeptide repeat protein [Hyphomonadaceae bacterium]|nr:tetratricopeptide repeat protein [Hyphomonadaceae bacterium]
MRRLIAAFVFSAVGLGGCERATEAPAAPESAALDVCLDDGAAPADRRTRCDEVLAQPALESAQRAAALSVRGELKRRAGDPTGALADFNAALALDEALSEAKLGRAAVLLDSGQLDAAEPLINGVIEQGDAPARANYLLGLLRARQGNPDAARTAFDASVAADNRNAEVFAARGTLRQAHGDEAGAMQDFDAALRLDGPNREALGGRCWSRVRQSGDLATALRDAEAALEVSVRDKTAQLCRGLIQLRREDWTEARAAYDAVLLNEPTNAAALYGRGLARRELGERDEAADDIRSAFRLDSGIDREFERLGVDD